MLLTQARSKIKIDGDGLTPTAPDDKATAIDSSMLPEQCISIEHSITQSVIKELLLNIYECLNKGSFHAMLATQPSLGNSCTFEHLRT